MAASAAREAAYPLSLASLGLRPGPHGVLPTVATLRWLVASGSSVREDQPIAEYTLRPPPPPPLSAAAAAAAAAATAAVGRGETPATSVSAAVSGERRAADAPQLPPAPPRVTPHAPAHTLRAPVSGRLVLTPPPTSAPAALLSPGGAVIRVCTHGMLFNRSLCGLCGADVHRLPRATRAFLERHAASAGAPSSPLAAAAVGAAGVAAASSAAAASVAEGGGAGAASGVSTDAGDADADGGGGGGGGSGSGGVHFSALRGVRVQHGYEIAVSDATAEASDAGVVARLRASRRLSLLLDLDHTLLHATCAPAAASAAAHHAFAGDISTFSDAAAAGAGGFTYFIKLRPGVREFLEAAAALFELQVDTAATRAYAQKAVAALDPTGRLFGGRIVSRCDSSLRTKMQTSWLHRTVKDDSMVLIVDDTEAMWGGARNLLVIEPYRFWLTGAEANNAAGASMTDVTGGAGSGAHAGAAGDAADAAATSALAGVCAEEPHAYLGDVLRVLTAVHTQYFAEWDAAVAVAAAATAPGARPPLPPSPPRTDALLQRYMHGVLDGCALVFSGVFPVVKPSAHPAARTPDRSPLWRRCVAFGARVAEGLASTTTLSPLVRPEDGASATATAAGGRGAGLQPASSHGAVSGGADGGLHRERIATHLVARVPGTAKVLEAEADPAVAVVQLAWLEESLKRYQRQPEAAYPLPGLARCAARDVSARQAALRAAAAREMAAAAAAAVPAAGGAAATEPAADSAAAPPVAVASRKRGREPESGADAAGGAGGGGDGGGDDQGDDEAEADEDGDGDDDGNEFADDLDAAFGGDDDDEEEGGGDEGMGGDGGDEDG